MGRPTPLAGRQVVLPVAIALGFVWLLLMLLAANAPSSPVTWVLRGVGLGVTGLLIVLVLAERRRLHDLVATDPLTGLTNHRGFHQLLRRALVAARDCGEQVAIVHLDLDDFKRVNDTHGHPYGDDMLRAVGVELRAVVRAGDVAARLGGDEFALILPDSDGEGASGLVARVRGALERIAVDDVALSCSAGIAVFPKDAADADRLVQVADAALYWAKRDGKGRTRCFDPQRVPVPRTRRQAEEIRALLARPQPVQPLFQPIVDLATGRIVGYEALARFPGSPERPVVSVFAAARASGLGAQLEACAIDAALRAPGRPIGTELGVNVSPSVLASPEVRSVLPDDLSDVVIEITEHELTAYDDVFARALYDLRERGALIAIDDTGAGYAGLKQVMSIRPDVVKLDRDLTAGIHRDPARRALVASFVRFARDTGTAVCAEGIESLEELAALADLDVSFGQGYALARPAEPWPQVSPVAVDVCCGALNRALRPPAEVAAEPADPTAASGDRGLERATASLASARSRADLEAAIGLIARELQADKVALSRWHSRGGLVETLAENGESSGETVFRVGDYPLTARVLRDQEAVQVLVGDPRSDRAEAELLLRLGHRSMLIVPVVSRGESVGIIELFSGTERTWTRAEISRARIIANQFASVIDAFFKAEQRPAERLA